MTKKYRSTGKIVSQDKQKKKLKAMLWRTYLEGKITRSEYNERAKLIDETGKSRPNQNEPKDDSHV